MTEWDELGILLAVNKAVKATPFPKPNWRTAFDAYEKIASVGEKFDAKPRREPRLVRVIRNKTDFQQWLERQAA